MDNVKQQKDDILDHSIIVELSSSYFAFVPDLRS